MKERPFGSRREDIQIATVSSVAAPTWRRRDLDGSGEGVSTSALTAAVASLAAPAWLFGAAAIFVESISGGSRHAFPLIDCALLLLGALGILSCARAAALLRNAPRLRGSDQAARLRYGAIVATVAAGVFLQRALWGGGDLSVDALALMGAVLPVVFIADLSRALARVADGRHGTDIGTRASYAWLLTSALLAAVAMGVGPWWIPALLASAAGAGSAVAGTRVWRRFEGDPAAN